MKNPIEIIANLDRFGLSAVPHSGASLLDHLIGTYVILRDWGEAETVCLGGLCHSIYGTEYFRSRSVDLAHREKVRETVGEEAEKLAYLFSAMSRQSLYANRGRDADFRVFDRFRNEEVRISDQECRALLAIAAANDLEQRERLTSSLRF